MKMDKRFDYYTNVAADVFKVKPEEVTKEQRKQVKFAVSLAGYRYLPSFNTGGKIK